ncbi:hypothetical protein [Parafrankia elaeagni]|uniref:hypothetical protein n=1 Tax=Parafrankia elaeagni TaxID=222534 RepID=UPI00039B4CCC|nr:hypothetical protein [Parafrankia elaeagni]
MVHHSSHRGLLAWCGPGTGAPLDAIVVSAARPAYNLITAMELAASVDAYLVLLCSGRAHADEVSGLAREVPGLRALVVDLSDRNAREPGLASLRLGTSRFTEAQTGHLGDLSLKRNLGLLLGRGAGWHSLLFLDDDMRDVRPRLALRAAAGLDRYDAVGMFTRDFPDNSVVCHANRVTGGPQDVFVSGSALVVNPQRDLGFFPQVYNEDWLFMFDVLARGRLAATGCVRQLRYDPFARPERAAAEEFGDLLAEGLMALLQAGEGIAAANASFWADFLLLRKEFIASAAERADSSSHPQRTAMLHSLGRAEEARACLSPVQLDRFIRLWRSDLDAWSQYRSTIAGGSLEDVAAALGLFAFSTSIEPGSVNETVLPPVEQEQVGIC